MSNSTAPGSTAGTFGHTRTGVRSGARALAWLVAIVLFLSFAGTVNEIILPASMNQWARLARWPAMGITAGVALATFRSRPSVQAVAWLASGLYAFATILYSFDLPATVLRSVAFTASVVALFWGGRTLVLLREGSAIRTAKVSAAACLLLTAGGVAAQVAGVGDVFHRGSPLFCGLYVHPNTLGAVIPLWVPVTLFLYDFSPKRRAARRLLLLSLALAAIALVESKSRTGMSATIVGVAAYFLATRKLSRLAGVGLVLLGLSVLVAGFVPGVLGEAREASVELVYKGRDDDVLRSRRGVMEGSLDNFAESPWFGFGFGSSPGAVHQSNWTAQDLAGREKGNAYLALLEEVGAVGTAVLTLPIALFLLSWRRLVQMNRSSRTPRAAFAAAAWAGAFAGLVHNNGEATLWSAGATFGAMLLFLAGLADGILSNRALDPERRRLLLRL
jgi:O-antigen ligase